MLRSYGVRSFARRLCHNTKSKLSLAPAQQHISNLYSIQKVQNRFVGNPPTATSKSVKTRSLRSLDLDFLAPVSDTIAYHNLSYGELADHEARHADGVFLSNGAFSVLTGKFTGRSPFDKFIVKQEPSSNDVWWGDINRAITPEVYDALESKVIDYYRNSVKDVYVFDGFCGAHEQNRRKVRFITEKSWHHHFVSNMFIKPTKEELANFGKPDFTVINCYGLTDEKWEAHGLHSEVFAAFNIEKSRALIGGAWYGGEMKKGIFSMMHYWLPKYERTLSMHCSANIGDQDDVCLFFGLSGTGKTTLSTDPKRKLIGDDEHGWDDEGIFNFEGGCYAKTVGLSQETEPEILNAIRPGALLENVWVNPETREADYFNVSLTENGRVSYPLDHIDNRQDSKSGPTPKYIIFLCCDAFGVLPPIARLNPGQAMYHFVSGYTAKVAGTERGIKEPIPNFSPCYGAAFLTLHPMKYAQLFKKKLEQFNVPCYLVNTGWSGGKYGVGKRMSIKTTRACIDAIFDGSVDEGTFRKDEIFHFDVPQSLPNVDSKILDPRNTWDDKDAYDAQYEQLGQMFADNFQLYASDAAEYSGFGPISQSK